MRLDNVVIIFFIHYALSVLILSTSPLTSSENIISDGGFIDACLRFFRDYLFIPTSTFLNITGIRFEGYMKYIPYIFNSILWAVVINYLLILINNFLNPKRLS